MADIHAELYAVVGRYGLALLVAFDGCREDCNAPAFWLKGTAHYAT
ncbi:MAG: hypothetical protein KTR19_00040 [Hyphomicrobiales bacterium]|nr:hypothetical protein [Hyphomicrobiales bacterium]